jgi:hypothetical protein
MLATCPPPLVDRGGLFDGQRAKSPGWFASISPPGAVCKIAPANVLHGNTRLQRLVSSSAGDPGTYYLRLSQTRQ